MQPEMPWRVGANETTTIAVSHDVKIEGKDLKAGTYGLSLDGEKDFSSQNGHTRLVYAIGVSLRRETFCREAKP